MERLHAPWFASEIQRRREYPRSGGWTSRLARCRDRTIVEPFFTGSFWHEFEGDNKASLTSAGYKLSFKDELDDSWGELGGGVNFFTSGTTSIFVKADALVGGDLDGWNVKGGGRFCPGSFQPALCWGARGIAKV